MKTNKTAGRKENMAENKKGRSDPVSQQNNITSLEWLNTFNAMGDGISIHSPDFHIIRANKSLGQMLGIPPEKLTGRICYQVMHGTEEPIADCPLAKYKAEGQITEIIRREPYLGDRWLQVRCDPVLNHSGELISIVHVVRDITLRRKAEEERRKLSEQIGKTAENLKYQRELLNIIVENTEAHLAYLDTDFNIMWVNSAYVRGSGHPLRELIGKNHFSLFPNEENRSIFEKVRDSGQAVEYNNKAFVYPDQPRRGVTYWDWTLTPAKDDSGKVQGLVLSLIDTTAHKKVEQLKDEFINIISHEMRTPLTVVIGALKTIIDETDKLSKLESLNLIKDAVWGAETLSHIQENLLELARSQANRLSLNTSLVSISEVAHKIVERVKQTTETHNFTLEFPEDLPLSRVDSIRLERILHNLLENAVKYSPSGGEIRIFASVEGGEMVIGVSDQGIGISPDQQERLFKPFERLAGTRDGVKGIGLGLVVCQRLVEAHHGRIWVESTPGKGSTFLFTLPANQGEI